MRIFFFDRALGKCAGELVQPNGNLWVNYVLPFLRGIENLLLFTVCSPPEVPTHCTKSDESKGLRRWNRLPTALADADTLRCKRAAPIQCSRTSHTAHVTSHGSYTHRCATCGPLSRCFPMNLLECIIIIYSFSFCLRSFRVRRRHNSINSNLSFIIRAHQPNECELLTFVFLQSTPMAVFSFFQRKFHISHFGRCVFFHSVR